MSMRIAILGAGGIGLASAAFLIEQGHQVVLWSPRRTGLGLVARSGLEATGKVAGRFWPHVEFTLSAAIRDAEVVLIALPAPARRAVFEALSPLLCSDQLVIVSADLSLGAHYLHQRLTNNAMIVAWSTTVLTGRRTRPGNVTVGGLRNSVAASVMPGQKPHRVLQLCEEIFGERFIETSSLGTLVGNLNPQVHMANVLCNLTRIENGEVWSNYGGLTPAVARLVLDLDSERLALANAIGVETRSVKLHFQVSFGLPDSMSFTEMAAEMHRRRSDLPGPTNLETRFIKEDLPFGIVPLLRLAALADVNMPLHSAGLLLLDSLCATEHASMNDLQTDHIMRELLAIPGSVQVATAPAFQQTTSPDG